MFSHPFYVFECFNPRSCERSDPACNMATVYFNVFQSTLLRKERLAQEMEKYCRDKVSIHAPAKGATGVRIMDLKNRIVSIHAPAKGATMHSGNLDSIPKCFNPRSCERSDTWRKPFVTHWKVFQSTLLRKERQQCICAMA